MGIKSKTKQNNENHPAKWKALLEKNKGYFMLKKDLPVVRVLCGTKNKMKNSAWLTPAKQ